MKKIFATLALAALCVISLNAIPALRKPVTITQKDGSTVTLILHGDEHHHWYTNLSGVRYAAGPDGIYRPAPATKSSGSFKPKRILTKTNNASITQGDKKFLVVLIEFSDVTFKTPNEHFSNMLNQRGYSENGATGSVYDYYYENSTGQFNPTWDVIGPIQVGGSMADYGANGEDDNDVNPDGLLAEALDIIHANGTVNFSDYDNDGDGIVDNVYYFYAGYGEAVGGADPNTIWPHSWALYGSNSRTFDGVRISSYACGPEFKGRSGEHTDNIGTFCHEFGHVLGLPDFYDTDYEENGENDGLDTFSLMASGCYNNDSRTPPLLNAEERVMLGWMDPSAIKEITAPGSYTLQPISNNVAYKTPTGNDGEYYLYECRTTDNVWDAGNIVNYNDAGTNGLVVYRVDKSANIVKGVTAKSRWENWNGINAIGGHPCFDLVSAKPDAYYRGEFMFPGMSGKDEFSDLTTPRSESWAGDPTGYNLTSIAFSGGVSTFVLDVETGRKVVGTVTDTGGNPVAGAAVAVSVVSDASSILTKGASEGFRSPSRISKAAKYNVTTDANGEYSVEIDESDADDFYLVISKEGYKTFDKEFTLSSGRIRIDAVLLGVAENRDATLSKYGSLGERVSLVGYGNKTDNVTAAVKFTADELKVYVGMRVSEIAFMFYGTSAERVDAIIESGNQRKVTCQVASPGYTDDAVNWTVADVKGEGYVIPSGEDVYFGYALKQVVSSNGYPVCYNDSEAGDVGGGYLARTYSANAATNWSTIAFSNDSGGYDYCNVIVAVHLVENIGAFDERKIVLIVNPSEGAAYKSGSTFNFNLTYGDIDDPSSVVWYYDGAEQSADSVTLSSGRHEVKAVLTYSDGSTEEIIQVIKVQ